MSFVSINNLKVSFGTNSILENFNLSFDKGEIYAIIGPSGCGKSTLLKTICGIIKPQGGCVKMMGGNLDAKKHNIGYIPQQYGLLDWLKVKNNIFIGEKIKRIRHKSRHEIIKKLAIGDLLERYPASLSGGQQQRVALARAWLLYPDLLLMDEPFSALDAFTSETSKDLFLKLWKEQKTTTIVVTHNVREAVHLGKHIVILSGQPAKVEQIIPNPLFNKGNSRTEKDFYLFEQEITGQITKKEL